LDALDRERREDGTPGSEVVERDPEADRGRPRQLSPFAKCAWVSLLRDISNLDKHRHLNVLTTSTAFVRDRPVRTFMDPGTNRQELELRGQIEISVTLPSGEDVIEAAKAVETESRALVRSYAHRLRSTPPLLIAD
jgi:hypothetical protein